MNLFEIVYSFSIETYIYMSKSCLPNCIDINLTSVGYNLHLNPLSMAFLKTVEKASVHILYFATEYSSMIFMFHGSFPYLLNTWTFYYSRLNNLYLKIFFSKMALVKFLSEKKKEFTTFGIFKLKT